MSWQSAKSPECHEQEACEPVDLTIEPRARDLGGFEVRRVLPSSRRRMVGPFIFFDQMGPADFPPGRGIDVRPHPHIGLATVTYLFQGTILHRDSLGSVQPITPGAVNWMTAGRGIVHSERSDPELRKAAQRLAGLQIWVALPERHEETAPAFVHTPAAALPETAGEGKTVRVVVGRMFGLASPVETLWEMVYADATLAPGAALPFDAEHEERATYLVEGTVEIAGERFEAGQMLVFKPRSPITITAASAARLVLIGGAPLGRRHIWWNFVSSRPERIEQAKEDWRAGRFPAVPGETELIPLPESL
jgi:redox-sensitive bicupin YhaK (pirin superfamily)